MRFLGAHVSASGGLANAIKNGEELGVNSIQTMFSAPMRWAMKEVEQKEVENFIEAQKNSSIKKLLIHGIYLINLARQDKQMFHMSKVSLMNHLDALSRMEEVVIDNGSDLEILGITFHPGSAKDLTPQDGVKRISQGLNWILEKVPGSKILLESSAGAGNIMGDKLEELAEMVDGVEQKDRMGYVLDTQHMFVSGYDWVNDLEGVVSQIESTIGLQNVKAIHLNDSMKPFASNRDRHADLGKGEIGLEAIRKIVNHQKFRAIPFLLETPALKSMDTAKKEVELLQEIAI